MIKDIIDVLKNASLRHKGIKTFKYQGKILINAQGGNRYYQVVVDDVSYHRLNITTGIFVSEVNMYILGFPSKDKDSILDVQNNAITIACDIMQFIDSQEEYQGVLSVYDYSFLTLANYTDDNAAGVRLTLSLKVPNPINLCEYEDNFNPEPYPEEEDVNIDIEEEEMPDLDLKEIKLPLRPKC